MPKALNEQGTGIWLLVCFSEVSQSLIGQMATLQVGMFALTSELGPKCMSTDH